MIKTLRFLFFLVFFTQNQPCFAQKWGWAHAFGNLKSDKSVSIKTDKQGNTIVAGYFQDSMVMGNGVFLRAEGHQKEIFIAKFDSIGNCVWAKAGNGFYDDRVLGICLDNADNIYITGTCFLNISLDGVALTSAILTPGACCDQCFVYKLDTDGAVLWGTLAGGYEDDQGLDITADNNGNAYVVGFINPNATAFFAQDLVLNTNYTNSQTYPYFVAKLDNTGKWIWAKAFAALPWDVTANKYVERDIALNIGAHDDLYITGGFEGVGVFGNDTLQSKGGTDVFLMKMTTNGVIQWTVAGGSRKDDWANGVATDSLGNVYITGEYRDSLYFNTILLKNYDKRDIFVAKFDAQNGSCLWAKRGGSDDGNERGNDIYADQHCNIYVTGEVGANAEFGAITTPNTANLQLFVAKISPAGAWLWVATNSINDTTNLRSNSIAKASNNRLYIAGNFEKSIQLGNNTLVAHGKTDGFVAQITDLFATECPNERIIKTQNPLSVFPNPTVDILNISVFLSRNEAITIDLYDILGKKWLSMTENTRNGENVFKINLSEFPPAVYILSVSESTNTYSQKIVIGND